MEYVIHSHEKVNGFSFGMTAEQVKNVAGDPEKEKHDRITERLIYTYGPCELTFQDNQLSWITLLSEAQPTLNGLNLFDKKDFDKLCDQEMPVVGQEKTYLLFEKSGVLIGGYGKRKIPEGKLVMVFPPHKLAFFRIMLDV